MKKEIVIVTIFIIIAMTMVLIKSRTSTETKLSKATVTRSVENKLPKLLDLGSHNCVPCKMMMPILDTLTREFAGALDVEFIDVWEKREESQKYKIRIIPTQIFFDSSGTELFRHEGFYPKDSILIKFSELGVIL